MSMIALAADNAISTGQWLGVGWGLSILMLVVGFSIGLTYYKGQTPSPSTATPDVDKSPEDEEAST